MPLLSEIPPKKNYENPIKGPGAMCAAPVVAHDNITVPRDARSIELTRRKSPIATCTMLSPFLGPDERESRCARFLVDASSLRREGVESQACHVMAWPGGGPPRRRGTPSNFAFKFHKSRCGGWSVGPKRNKHTHTQRERGRERGIWREREGFGEREREREGEREFEGEEEGRR